MPKYSGWRSLSGAGLALGIFLFLVGPTSGAHPEAATDSDIIPGRYIVLLKGPGSPRAVTARLGLQPQVVYEHGLWGFAGEFSDRAIRRLRADPAVLSIEPDRVATVDDAQPLPFGVDRVDADLNSVAKIDGIDDLLDADIAIIDTGIQPDHPDLRVAGGVPLLGSDCAGDSWADGRGHGTHVAGTAAAIDNSIGVVGVAPGARLWSVRVFDDNGSSSLSCIIAGVDWVTANAATVEVANMSIKTSPSTALCQAITASASAGVVYAVSAGNNHLDASSQSPANCADVLTTSAIADFDGMPGGLNPQTYNGSCTMTGDDIFACFSNYGPLVEIAAPGVWVYSTYFGYSYATMSGTSMAAPHVTGAAALDIVEHGKPTDAAGAAAVRARLIAAGAAQDGPLGFTGDPDSYHEPLLFLRSPGAYDAAVSGVTAPALIMPAELVPVDVALWHDASSSHTLSVALTASGGSVLDSPQTVTLGPDSFATVPFTWDTTAVLPGDHSLTATVVGPAGDMNPGNNSLSITATVRLPMHDVAVEELDAPSTVVEGDQVPVQVTATNPGTFSETFSVALTPSGGTVSGSPQTLTLEPGSSATVPFTWDTTGLPPGDYALTAATLLEGDANLDNDSRWIAVAVRAPEHDVAIAELGAPPEVAEDSQVPVSVTATNPGTFSETFSVSLEASGGSVLGSPRETTLAPGGSAPLSFTWHTPDASPLPYILTATAEPVPGEGSISNNSLAAEVLVVVPPILVVNTTADPGSGVCDATECTLREAITSANAAPGPARIEFDISPGGPQTIAPLSRLPDITDSVTIDGTTQPGYAGSPIIELTGAAFEPGFNGDGLRILSGYSTVRGLVINRFRGDGIELSGQGGNLIQGNFIGLDMSGYLDLGNTGNGVRIDGIANNIIGGTSAAERNVISGNEYDGIGIAGASATGNLVQGNYIGTSRDGVADLGNGNHGIRIDNADANTIGGTEPGAGNVISGNYRGLLIYGCNEPRPTGNVVQGNLIGTDASGTIALGNGEVGVEVHCATDTIVGGTAPTAGNVISANSAGSYGTGLSVHSSSGTVIQGNRIGTDITGTLDLGNYRWGVYVAYSVNTTIGGTAAGAGNVISGNGEYGVSIYPGNSGTTVQGNFIGTDVTGTVALGNGRFGVHVNGSTGTTIGGTAPGAANVVCANGWDGIAISDDAGSTVGSVIQGNFVGTDVTGTVALGNSRDGVSLWARNVTVGGTAAGAANTIAYNSGRGVDVGGPTSTGNSIRGNSIHSNAGKGIDNWNGGNAELAPPTITGVGPVAGTACANCAVDVYSDSTYEGRIYHGFTQADGAGNWSFSGGASGPYVTATATDASGNTSEFSARFACGSDCATSTPTPSPSPTPTATPMPTPPPAPAGDAVGGIAVLPDLAESADSPARAYALLAGGVAALAMALTTGAWYARRRWQR